MDKHYESLARLYLRLKGYIASNLILHSDQGGNSKSELDVVAVRMPHHAQEYRWVNVPDYLECSDSRVEILLGDVKNYAQLDNVEFNKGLRRDRESIRQLIDWLGVYENVTEEQIDKFESNLNLHRNKELNGFAEFNEDLPLGKFKFKFTFFCPSLTEWNGKGFKYIHGKEMIDFAWECLNETKKIKTCSRRYDFGGWNELEYYVRFFKGKQGEVTIKEFEEYCKNVKL
jgi:hypothetical protein